MRDFRLKVGSLRLKVDGIDGHRSAVFRIRLRLRNHSLDGAETWKTAGSYRRRLVSDMAFLQWLHRAKPAAFPASGALLPKTLTGLTCIANSSRRYRPCAGRFRLSPISGQFPNRLACLKRAISGSGSPTVVMMSRHPKTYPARDYSGNPARRRPSAYLARSSGRRSGT